MARYAVDCAQADGPVQVSIADRADADQRPHRLRVQDEVGHVARRSPRRSAAQAVNLTGLQGLLPGLAGCQEFPQIGPVDEIRSPALDQRKAAADPSTYGELMHAEELADLCGGVGPMDLDA